MHRLLGYKMSYTRTYMYIYTSKAIKVPEKMYKINSPFSRNAIAAHIVGISNVWTYFTNETYRYNTSQRKAQHIYRTYCLLVLKIVKLAVLFRSYERFPTSKANGFSALKVKIIINQPLANASKLLLAKLKCYQPEL